MLRDRVNNVWRQIMKNRTLLSGWAELAVGLVAAGILVEDTRAQTSATWTAGTGSWSAPGNWSTTPVVPNNGQAGAGDTYNVTLNTNGTVTQDLAGGVTVNGFTQSRGTFAGGNLAVLSSLSIGESNFATVGGTGTLTLEAGATGLVQFASITRPFVNKGTLEWGSTSAGGGFTNTAGGIVNVTGDGSLDVQSTMTNEGLINLNGFGTTFANSWVNSGTINLINSGGVFLQGSTTTTGTYNVGTGSRLIVSSGTYAFTPTSTISGPGRVEFQNGAMVVGGAYNAAATSVISGATVTFNGVDKTLANLEYGGGMINGSANLNFTGNLSIGAGSTLGGSGTARLMPGATGVMSSIVGTITLNRAFFNAGNLTIGTATFAGSGTITNETGGVVTVNHDVSRTIGVDFVNRGNFERMGGPATTTFSAAASFTNEGNVKVTDGTLVFGGGYTQTAGTLLLAGGSVTGNLAISGGSLAGSGPITGNVSVTSGAISPGSSAGTLTVNGNLTLGGDADLVFEIGGLGALSDALVINGTVPLSLETSDLVLQLINAFLPAASDTFAIMDTQAAITGLFANVSNGQRLEVAGGIGSFQVNYGVGSAFDPDKVVLSNFVAIPEPGTLGLIIGGLGLVLAVRRMSGRHSRQ
jgi:hypothetical protein